LSGDTGTSASGQNQMCVRVYQHESTFYNDLDAEWCISIVELVTRRGRYSDKLCVAQRSECFLFFFIYYKHFFVKLLMLLAQLLCSCVHSGSGANANRVKDEKLNCPFTEGFPGTALALVCMISFALILFISTPLASAISVYFIWSTLSSVKSLFRPRPQAAFLILNKPDGLMPCNTLQSSDLQFLITT
jgi:hypothetical protein